LWLYFPQPGSGLQPPRFSRFLDHTRRPTVGRTPLDEWTIRRRDLYLTTPNTHNRQTSMPPVGFERTISAGERPKTYALDRKATGTGNYGKLLFIIYLLLTLHFVESNDVFSLLYGMWITLNTFRTFSLRSEIWGHDFPNVKHEIFPRLLLENPTAKNLYCQQSRIKKCF
jgi:hypothetical protein